MVQAISLLVHADQADSGIRDTVHSVLQQTTDDWELLLLDSNSLKWDRLPGPAANDGRIRHIQIPPGCGLAVAANMGVSAASTALIAFLEVGDRLEPHALAEVLESARTHPAAELLYTDEDIVDADHRALETCRKPAWSPQLLRATMYLGQLTVLRTSAVRAVGGFRPEYDGAVHHDLALRVGERAQPVVHIAKVLHHRRAAASTWVAEQGLRAVSDHLSRQGLRGTPHLSGKPEHVACDRLPEHTTASLIIPTRGTVGTVGGSERVFVKELVASILSRPSEVEYDLVLVHDLDSDAGYLENLRELAGERLKVVDYTPPFNFSAKINLGVEASSGEILVLLNDDMQIISDRWLDQLVAIAQEPDVGAVGAKLIFEDGSIQHAGHMFDNGDIRHIGVGEPAQAGGSNVMNDVDREVVGVTAACLVQRRAVWQHMGGLDESLPNNFNDVDYCNRTRAKGYRIVQANSVLLFHYESRTRQPVVEQWEVETIIRRLGRQLQDRDLFTSSATSVVPPTRSRTPREWLRVSRETLRDEGPRSFARKARKRLSR